MSSGTPSSFGNWLSAHTAFFFEPQTDRGMAYIQQIKTALAAMPPADPAAPDANEPLRQLVAQAELALNTDAQLAVGRLADGAAEEADVALQGAAAGEIDGGVRVELDG